MSSIENDFIQKHHHYKTLESLFPNIGLNPHVAAELGNINPILQPDTTMKATPKDVANKVAIQCKILDRESSCPRAKQTDLIKLLALWMYSPEIQSGKVKVFRDFVGVLHRSVATMRE
jgi:hypothetical protein